MKNTKKISVVFLLISILCFSSCDILDPLNLDSDVFDPSQTNSLSEPDFVDYTVSRILYDGLTETEKQAYRRIYNAVFGHPAKILLPLLTEEQISRVYTALKYDNPHLLCLCNTYTYYVSGSKCYILPEYNSDTDECNAKCTELISEAKAMCKNMPQNGDEYSKELYLHDTLINAVSYSDLENSDTAYGAVVNKKAACGGYALACMLLFDIAGIKSTAVSGNALNAENEEIPHMWLAAEINSEWYFVDPAWDDPVSDSGKNILRHTYFNINEAQLSLTHSGYTLPEGIECGSQTADYYTVSGLFCTTADAYDILRGELEKTVRIPAHIELRFDTAENFETAVNDLFTQGNIAELLSSCPGYTNGENGLSHSEDTDRNIMHIYIN